jgi:hypothetical protein
MVDRVTIRESGVLHLIARGLYNAGIGGTLVITEDTTKNPRRPPVAKLNLRDHAQAVVLACETGLVSRAADYQRPSCLLSRQCGPALYTLHSACVGERRAARMAGSSPARAPMTMAAARPPAQASGGMTMAQPLAWA